MRIYNIAFYIAGFFILGVLLSSLGLNFLIIVAATLLIAAMFLFINYFIKAPPDQSKFLWLAVLALFVILGALYYFWRDKNQVENLNIVFDKKIDFQGLVVNNPERGTQQKLIIALQFPYSGKILAKSPLYPSFDYGDLINFEGVINPSTSSGLTLNNIERVKKPEPINYADYLAKDGIFGIINFPKTELVAKNQGSVVKSLLFRLKEKIVTVFQKTLVPEKAAFLAGITLGERAEFSKEFKEAMNKSGTTHLVALSGYNITVIVMAMFALFNYFSSRRSTFILTTFAIFGFVLMTGAEASVVRAAIMGFIALLASQVSRLYSVRNAIVLAAFFMILINPKVLYFDVGFQLSFLALLGIVYLKPAIQKFFHSKEELGFLSWRDNFFTTFSAQLAVAPLLILSFGQFSPLSLLTNILILSVIPLTMFSGFTLAALGFVSDYFALIFAWFVNLLLSYEVFIIKLFGGVNILQIKSLTYVLIIVYYCVLIGFILYNNYRQRHQI